MENPPLIDVLIQTSISSLIGKKGRLPQGEPYFTGPNLGCSDHTIREELIKSPSAQVQVP